MRLGRERLRRVLLITALIAAPVLTPIAAFAQSSVTGDNTSEGAEASSGDAKGTNSASGQTGQSSAGTSDANAQDVNNAQGTNVQEGDNRTTIRQTSNVRTGDAVAGQVIGGVVGAGGRLSIDATNRSEGVTVETGDAEGSNTANVVTGLVSVVEEDNTAFVREAVDSQEASASDLTNVVGRNVQEGDNRATVRQNVNAQSGDGVGGQVIGAVVGPGGSASIAAANTTRDTDITTGDAEGSNDLSAFVGLLDFETGSALENNEEFGILADITNATGDNIQEGDNRLNASQSANAQTGDGVGGQVIGVVSGGATSVDATNLTEDSFIETGDSTAENDAGAFVGLLDFESPSAFTGEAPLIQDITNAAGTNLQEGDNRKTLSQSANAVSGDAVAGQVAGVVTSAGGSASVVLANRSEGVDATSGEADFVNEEGSFTGLLTAEGTLSVGEVLETGLAPIFRSAIS